MHMEYVMGVDAGGTATTAAIYDWDTGNLIGKGCSGYGNALVDYEQALSHIREAIGLAKAGVDGHCRFMLVGAAGATSGGLNERIARELQASCGCEVAVETDARLALEGALEGGDGILLVSGTGSIAQGRKNETILTAGGWGHLVGDEGSGYDLVRRTIRLMTEDADHGRPERTVCRKVREFFGQPGTRQVIGYLHGHVKAEIANAAPVVVQAAVDGDPDSLRLLEDTGDALAGLVACLSARLGLPPGFRLALQGSIVRKVTVVRERLLATLKERGIAVSLVADEGEWTRGAWHYAKALEHTPG